MATITVTVGTETISANEMSPLPPFTVAGAGSASSSSRDPAPQQLPSILCQASSRTPETSGGVRHTTNSTAATRSIGVLPPGAAKCGATEKEIGQGVGMPHGAPETLHRRVTACVQEQQGGEAKTLGEEHGKEETKQPLGKHSGGVPKDDEHEQEPVLSESNSIGQGPSADLPQPSSSSSTTCRSRQTGVCGYEADAECADGADDSDADDSEKEDNGQAEETEDVFVDAQTGEHIDAYTDAPTTPIASTHFDLDNRSILDSDSDSDTDSDDYEDAYEHIDVLEKMAPTPSAAATKFAVQEALDALEGRRADSRNGGGTREGASEYAQHERTRLLAAAAAAGVLLHTSGRAAKGHSTTTSKSRSPRSRRISSQETLCDLYQGGRAGDEKHNSNWDATDPNLLAVGLSPNASNLLRRSMSAPIANMHRTPATVIGGIQIQTHGLHEWAGTSPSPPPPRYLPDYASPSPRSYALWQPAFPQVFDIFDYGDGQCYYLGGGGRRLTRHLSRYRRRDPPGGMNAMGSGHLPAWPYEHPPLYACRLHELPRRSGLPPLVLYGGPDADADGAWADVKFGVLGSGMTVGLPPVAPDGFPAWSNESLEEEKYGGLYSSSGCDEYDARVDEKVSVHYGWHTRFRFEIEVGPRSAGGYHTNSGGSNRSGKMKREAFEWRYCSGESLEALHAKRWPSQKDNNSNSNSYNYTTNKKQKTSKSTTSKTAPPQMSSSARRRVVNGAPAANVSAAVRALAPATAGLARHVSLKRGFSFRRQEDSIHGGHKKGSCRWSGGWQLVRLDHSDDDADITPRASLGPIVGTPGADRPQTPDGHEIVATWANVSPTWKASRRKNHPYRAGRELAAAAYTTATTTSVARFSFLGSGRSGQLGERWALMAVASGLAVWERERRQRRRRQQTVMEACGGFASIA